MANDKAHVIEDIDKFIVDVEHNMHRHRAECDADRALSRKLQWMLVGSNTLMMIPLFAAGRMRVVAAMATLAIAVAGVGIMMQYDRRAAAASVHATAAIPVIDRARQLRSMALFGEHAEDAALQLKYLIPLQSLPM